MNNQDTFKIMSDNETQRQHDNEVLKTKYKKILDMDSVTGKYPSKSHWIKCCEQGRVQGRIMCLGDDLEQAVFMHVAIENKRNPDKYDYEFF